MTVYIDISDVIEFLKHHSTVSGIQRVQLEFARFFSESQWETVNFILLNHSTQLFELVEKKQLLKVIDCIEARVFSRSHLSKYIDKIVTKNSVVKFKQGDVFFVAGAFWMFPNMHNVFARLKQSKVIIGFLCYDLIPIMHGEFCDEGLTKSFKRCIDGCLINADFVFTISQYVADDLQRYIEKNNFRQRKIIPLLLAHNLPKEIEGELVVSSRFKTLKNKKFVLFVSTIETRKNHLYTFQLWQRLQKEYNGALPDLVWVGRKGWLVDDLMNRVRRTDNLDGALKVFHEVSDADLRYLYENCLFTIYPSYAEGYGLPVAESLVFKKPCISSNLTSLPEVGGDFVWYIDPYNVTQGVELVSDLLTHPEKIDAAAKRIANEFAPRLWSEVAQELIAGILKEASNIIEVPIENRFCLSSGKIFNAGGNISQDNFVSTVERATVDLMFNENWYDQESWGRWLKGREGSFILYRGAGATAGEYIIFLELQSVHFWGASQFEMSIPSMEFQKTIKIEPGHTTAFYVKCNLDNSKAIEIVLSVPETNVSGSGDPRPLSIGLRAFGYACESIQEERIKLLEATLITQKLEALDVPKEVSKAEVSTKENAQKYTLSSHIVKRMKEDGVIGFCKRSFFYAKRIMLSNSDR